ncbi:MAG: hypothetical protein Q7K13_11690, partial [Polynucleobacter sp.]|uniref:hypothetical protein n=1 Tax=Polynucleobacter sp. TaxID=2029855 RepID=UPI0027252B39
MTFEDQLDNEMQRRMFIDSIPNIDRSETVHSLDEELEDLRSFSDDLTRGENETTLAAIRPEVTKPSMDTTALVTTTRETLPKPPTASSPPLTGYHFPLGIVAPALATGMSNEERLRRLVSVWT